MQLQLHWGGAVADLRHALLLRQVDVVHRKRQLVRSQLALDEGHRLRTPLGLHGLCTGGTPECTMRLLESGHQGCSMQVATCLVEAGALHCVILRWLEPPIPYTRQTQHSWQLALHFIDCASGHRMSWAVSA